MSEISNLRKLSNKSHTLSFSQDYFRCYYFGRWANFNQIDEAKTRNFIKFDSNCIPIWSLLCDLDEFAI